MRTRIAMVICLCLPFAGRASTQWVISDPGNLAQGIINAPKNTTHTSKTTTNMASNLQETVKIYQQGKKHYDALKSMNNPVKDARKVQQTTLMMGNITDIHMNNFQRVLRDGNFRPEEFSVIALGYTKLLKESSEVLTELRNVVNTTTLSMTDKERIGVVERCHSKTKCYRNLVSHYMNKNTPVSYLRAKKKDNLDRITGPYGNMNERYWQLMKFDNLHQTLYSLYGQMMPPCGDMAGAAKGIAGLGVLFYVVYQVWQSLARAGPIDVLPMLRPFAIGLYIMSFPTVALGMINSILLPIVQGTTKMLEAETLDMDRYREQRGKPEHEAIVCNPETAYLVFNKEFDKQPEELGWSPSSMVTMVGIYIDRGVYNMREGIRDSFREILELLFQAAALVIGTVRTFLLVVLAILGPTAFALSVWGGFQNTFTQRICRYTQVYLWLPVSGMLGIILAKIRALMLQNDTERMQADPNFSLDPSDGMYIVFLCIGTTGHFTIPIVAGWTIQAEGMDDYGRNVNQMAGRAGSMAGSAAGAAAGNAVGRVGKLLKQSMCNHKLENINGIRITQKH